MDGIQNVVHEQDYPILAESKGAKLGRTSVRSCDFVRRERVNSAVTGRESATIPGVSSLDHDRWFMGVDSQKANQLYPATKWVGRGNSMELVWRYMLHYS